jgi:hypothetical protein
MPAEQGGYNRSGHSWTDPDEANPAENRKVGGSIPSLPTANAAPPAPGRREVPWGRGRLGRSLLRLPTGTVTYRRVAFAAANLSLAVSGVLLVSVFLRLHADAQRLYGVFLAFTGLLIGSVLLLRAMSIPASAGQASWRRVRPRWPVIPRRRGYRVDHRRRQRCRGGGDHRLHPLTRGWRTGRG